LLLKQNHKRAKNLTFDQLTK